MTLPAYSGVGASSETAPAWPTHAAGDLGLLFATIDASSMSTPSGWTLVPGMPSVTSLGVAQLWIWYRIATSSSESAPTLSATGNTFKFGVIITYTGVHQQTPVHGMTVGWQGSATAQSISGTTTLLDDCLVLSAFAWVLDSAGPLSSGLTNSDLASLATRFDGGTTTGNGGGILVFEGALATHGTIKTTTFTLSSNSQGATATLALQDAGRTLPVLEMKSREANTGM